MSTSLETLSDYELERGKPMPSTVHSLIQGNLIFLLKSNYGETYHVFPELSLDTPDKTPLVPDIAIYPKFEVDRQKDVLRREDAPLATIEILSPKQSLHDLIEKTHRYFQLGVTSCWIVIPSMDAIAVNHQPGKYTFYSGTEVLQDDKLNIQLPLAEIFK